MTIQTINTAEAAVLEAAAAAVDATLIRPSDVGGSEAAEAVRLDREVRAGFTVVLGFKDRLLTTIKEAKDKGIHKMLLDPETGKAYKSWTAYMSIVIANLGVDFKGMGARDKAFLVVLLYNTGMSQPVIASALKIGVGTVNRAVQAGRADGSVDKARETDAKDGRTFKGTEEGAAVAKAKAEKTATEKAEAHVKALSTLIDQMDEVELVEFKKALTALGRQVNTLVKK